jgi:alkylated DNA repair dioxygenase AlkB
VIRELSSGGTLELIAGWLSSDEADRVLAALIAEVPWSQGTIVMFGREVSEPRLSAWLGDPGARYTYSGRVMTPAPWTTTTKWLRDRCAEHTGVALNSVLVNRYRDGNDSMGFHADDEPELGENPVIASVSLGATRRFQLRHRRDRDDRVGLDLDHGSLLVMGGTTQHHYRHAVPKTKRPGERVNLTFRRIVA